MFYKSFTAMKNKPTHSTDNRQRIQRSAYESMENISLWLLLRKWWKQARRIQALMQFYFHKLTFGRFQSLRISMFHVAVLGIAICIFFKKDLHFQVRMNAPDESEVQSKTTSHQSVEQLSVAPTFSFSDTPTIDLAGPFSQTQAENYIKRFAKIAVAEHHKFGVPASIKMAQALLESQAGQNQSAVVEHNHFGAPLAVNNFSSAWENWRAHSLLFSSEQYPYQQLLQHGKDYKKWAKGLEILNYSSQKDYAKNIINLIESYELFRLDAI